jgi:hypothetical protein
MFIDELEPRRLMSVSPVSEAVEAARLQVQADLVQFKSDVIVGVTTLEADCVTLKADGLKADKTLTPLFNTLHSDVQTMLTALKADRLTEYSNVLHDESIIVAQKLKILGDKGNSTQKQADQAVLVHDLIQLQSDEIAGLNSRLATREADETTISNDVSAIITAADRDSNASPQLVTEVNKFGTDRTNLLNTLTADLNTLITDRGALVTALTAEEGSLS